MSNRIHPAITAAVSLPADLSEGHVAAIAAAMNPGGPVSYTAGGTTCRRIDVATGVEIAEAIAADPDGDLMTLICARHSVISAAGGPDAKIRAEALDRGARRILADRLRRILDEALKEAFDPSRPPAFRVCS